MKSLKYILAGLASCFPLANLAAEASVNADWARLAAYHEADQALLSEARDPERIVFMGDSITEGWKSEPGGLFPNPHHVNRGISGQTTPQMLVRFRQDVIDLRPRAVVILAGTNDIAGNTGPATNAEIENNIASMVDLARAHGIKVVLGTLVPAARYPWAPDAQPVPRIGELNLWIRDYAKREKLLLADFYPVMTSPENALRADLGDDGVHPNIAGYALMEQVLMPILRKVGR